MTIKWHVFFTTATKTRTDAQRITAHYRRRVVTCEVPFMSVRGISTDINEVPNDSRAHDSARPVVSARLVGVLVVGT